MKYLQRAAIVCMATISVAMPSFLAAQSVRLQEIGRPSVAFFEENPEAAGIHSSLFSQLNIEQGDTIKITSPTGNVLGVSALPFGSRTQTIYLNQRMRNLLNVEDGNITTTIERKAWPTSHAGGSELRFNRVLRPPESFLEYGDAVGLSLADMERLQVAPGMNATIEGPGGSANVTVQLLDRGPGTILMKLTLRRAIGIDDGEGQNVRLTVRPSRVSPGGAAAAPVQTGPLEWLSLPDAASAARDSGRPILLVVEGPRSEQVRGYVESPEARRQVGQCHLTQFDPGSSAAMTQRLGITDETSILFLTGSGNVISRIEGVTTAAMISAAAEAAISSTSN